VSDDVRSSPSPSTNPPPSSARDASFEFDATIAIDSSKGDVSLGTSGPIPSANVPVPTPKMIGRYRILGKLGEGGMGIVYEAEQQNPRRKVALKVVRGGTLVDDDTIRMFRREAETLARLRHPNIGAIYESGHTEDGQHYFAMELVIGDHLDKFLLKRTGGLTTDEVRFRLALFRRIAEAVHYAHQRGVIHRDLKPSNIIVSSDASSEMTLNTLAGVRLPDVKILDFGLARITEGDVHATQVTEVGVLKGTLPYMAPEQARGQVEAIDVRTDVYALGVILYEMLTGSKPYDLTRGSLIDAVRVICEEQPKSMRSTLSGARRLGQDLETVVGKALAKEPDRRYSSASALADDIERYLSEQPILARPPSTMYQIQKFAQRNRALVAGVAATFIVLVAGVVVSSMMAVRAMKAEALAKDQLARALSAEAHARTQSEIAVQERAEAVTQRTFAEQERAVAAEQKRAAILSGEQAHLEASKASAINRFLKDLLATADPWAGDAGKVTLDAALLQAQKRIGKWAGTDPDVDYAIRGTLASAFAGVGRYNEAEALLRGGLERQATEKKPNPVLVSGLHRQIGTIQMQTTHYDLAEAEFREALAVRTRARQIRDDVTPLILSQIASSLAYQGRFAQADTLVRQATSLAQSTGSRLAGPEILRTRAYIESHWKDDFAGADALLKEAVARYDDQASESSVETADALEEQAGNRVRMGDLAGADSLFKASIEMRRRVLGDEHPLVARALENQSTYLYRTGRTEQTLAGLQQVLAIRQRGAGPESTPVGRTWVSLGPVYAKAKRYREAENAFDTGLRILRKQLGDHHPDLAGALKDYSDLRVQQGRLGEAERMAREALAIRVESQGSNSVGALAQQVALANILRAKRTWSSYPEAEGLLLKARDAGIAERGERDANALRATQGLIQLYEAWGKPAEARKWREVSAQSPEPSGTSGTR